MPDSHYCDYLEPDELPERGVKVASKVIKASGEERFALRFDGGMSVTVTRVHSAGWQETHHHDVGLETYNVWKGDICICTFDEEGEQEFHWLRSTDIYSVAPGVIHNVFVFKGALFCTENVPTGVVMGGDRYPDGLYDKDLPSKNVMQMYLRERQKR